jgi:YihY family inner membrane protein
MAGWWEVSGWARSLDRWQRRYGPAGFVFAVVRKYSEDQVGYVAAAIAYYAFFSIFPLLLVFTTVLGFVLDKHGHLYQSLIDSALGQFPVIGRQLHTHSLSGSTFGVVVGICLSAWAGMRVFMAAEDAMNRLWDVPFPERPGFLRARLRALGLLVLLGGGVLVATILASLATFGASYGTAWKIGSILLSTLLNIGLFWVGLRLLTAKDVSWHALRGGAIAAGIAYMVLQAVGGFYVGHVLKSASDTYGTFALVIGLLSWIYLSVHTTLLAAEGNVVATRRLWPRSLSIASDSPPTDADRQALTQQLEGEEQRSDEQIEVDFAKPGRRPSRHDR